jgi:Domain of unknown function (DUF4286)
MLDYEVILRVREDLRTAWEAYLPAHVADVFATGCFEAAVIHRGEPGEYRCRYTVSSRAMLDRYLSEFAPAMRADTRDHFPVGVEITRAVWTEWKRLGR